MNYNLNYNFIFSDLCSSEHVSYEKNSRVEIDFNSNIPFHLCIQQQDYMIYY